MAITADTSTGFSGNTTTGGANMTVTFTGFTAASGALIVVGSAVRHPTTLPQITGITYNGIALLADRYNSFSFGAAQNWCSDPLAAPIGDGSPHNFVVTTDVANCDVVLSVSSWLGVGDMHDLAGGGGNKTGTGTAAATDSATAAVGEVIVDHVVVANSSTTATPSGTQTSLANTAITSSIRDAGSSKPGATSVTMSWTLGASVQWFVQAMALMPGTTPPPSGAAALTESFNKADGALGPDLTWTNLDSSGNALVVSNTARLTTVSGAARAEADLASANHAVQANVTLSGAANHGVGVLLRWAPAAMTYYGFWIYTFDSGASFWTGWRKTVAGTGSNLGTDAVLSGVTYGAGKILRAEVTGTSPNITLRGFYDGVLIATLLGETSIDGNVRTGFGMYRTADTGSPITQIDNFRADIGQTDIIWLRHRR